MSTSEERLKRLTETDYCQADSAEYRMELLKLAEQVADARMAKKRSRFFKALASEKRVRIVKLLAVREMCVCELMIALDLTQPNISHHIQILENVDILTRTKKGKWVYCSITDQKMIENLIDLKLL